jgi:hypothetical protein
VARKNKYPGVYARWNALWIQYRDENGEKVRESTGLPLGKERDAYQMLKTV